MHGAYNTCQNACILSTKMHMHSCMRTYTTVQKLLCHESYCQLLLSLREHRACCCLLPALLLARRIQSPDAVRSRNPSKSTLARDTVAAAVSHKHYLIIRVQALVRVSSSLSMVHACTWPRTSPSTKFYFRHGFHGLSVVSHCVVTYTNQVFLAKL